MQVWNTFSTAFDFMTIRIPSTTIFTSTCVSLGSDTVFRFVFAFMFFTFVNAQFFTVLFCLLRVIILYTAFKQDERCKFIFIGWSLVTYILSLADSVPHLFGAIVCMQLDTPFQDGAVFITGEPGRGSHVLNVIHFWVSTSIILIIFISTGLVVLKLRSKKIRSVINRSMNRTKAERTLTITTILIIIPLIFIQFLTTESSLTRPYLSYIIAIRPLMLDLRVNVVSIYFYYMQPMFKRKESTVLSANVAKTIGSLASR